jgi:hypothetical protein
MMLDHRIEHERIRKRSNFFDTLVEAKSDVRPTSEMGRDLGPTPIN